MFNRVKSILTWLWIGALFTATVGISVHRIYCHCAGLAAVSVFTPRLPCHTEAAPVIEKTSCCQKTTPAPVSCCTATPVMDAATACSGEGHEQGKCMDTTTELWKIKSDLAFEPIPVHEEEFSFEYPLWLRDLPIFKRYFRPAFCQVMHPPAYPKPPPLSGREIGQRIQVFRI